jgi:hypothetical protein
MLDHASELNAQFDAIFNEILPEKDMDLRGTCSPLPNDINYYMNDAQRLALHSLENFGWQLAFIRRPSFLSPLVVLKNSDQTKLAVLELDGSVNLTPQIVWRH